MGGQVLRIRCRDDLEAIRDRALERLDAAVSVDQWGLVGLRIAVGTYIALMAWRLDFSGRLWCPGFGA